MNNNPTDPDRISNLNTNEINEAIRKKSDSGVPTVLFVGFIGFLGMLCSIVGAICYYYSMGINPIVDWLADYARFIGLAITALVFIMLAASIIFYLVQWRWKAVLCSVILFMVPLFSLAVIMPSMGRISPKYFREECGKHLQEIGLVLDSYGKQHEGQYPGLDWCDILLKDDKIRPRGILCRGVYVNSIEGICSYALNEQVVGKNKSDMPADIVILFETDAEAKDPQYSMTEARRKILRGTSVERYFRDGRIKEGQWNQVGGVEIVSCSHHAGVGSNILFADGHVEFVRKKDIPNLRWKPEGN